MSGAGIGLSGREAPGMPVHSGQGGLMMRGSGGAENNARTCFDQTSGGRA
jgi:hypothetical protein